MAKPPPPYSERKFALVPKSAGPGYVVAEIIGADEIKPDMIRVRRWDTADKKFGATVGIKRTQIIGDVLPSDSRLVAIETWCKAAIADFHAAEEKKKADRGKKKTMASDGGGDA